MKPHAGATEHVKQVWESQARAWYEQRRYMLDATLPVHQWMVEHLDPKPGQRILEIAAGPGETGFLAAKLLGESGRLVSTDIAPAMVDMARKLGGQLGIENADYRVLDAQAMDLADASFDGVLCRWGFMLMPDPAAALNECRRVLVPGGRLVLAVFTGPDDNPFAGIAGRALREAGHLPAPDGSWQPGIVALGDRSALEDLVTGAGFRTTALEKVDMRWTFDAPEYYWSFLLDVTAFGLLLRSLSDSDRDAIRRTILPRLTPFTTSEGIVLPSACWCCEALAEADWPRGGFDSSDETPHNPRPGRSS